MSLLVVQGPGYAADGPGIHSIKDFVQGVFTGLATEDANHRLSLREIEKQRLDGKSTEITDVLALMAAYNRLPPRVGEPQEVRGKMPVLLPANTMGDEAYSTCFVALTYNGLVLAGSGGELALVRPETQPDLAPPKRPWDRNHILSTQLFHLGYLSPDPIMRRYRDQIGTREGHVVLHARSNLLIVIDTEPVLEKLQGFIDAEILEAMGVPASEGHAPSEGPRPPSLGAIVSRENLHFYLLAYARWSRIPLVAAQQSGVFDRYYSEADLWTNEQGFRALRLEHQRVHEYVRLARQTRGQGWVDPNPERTLSPRDQKRLAIRFGLVSPLPAQDDAPKTKKAPRRRR
jgi:hypothetical protein